MSTMNAISNVPTSLGGRGMALNLNSFLQMVQLATIQAQTREVGCQTGMVYSTCRIQPSPGHVSGTVDFAQSVNTRCEATGDLEMKVDIQGLPITDNIKKHGFHIHQLGDITNGCGSTGSHYNPFNGQHGGPNSQNRHFGDLGNVEEDNYGNIKTILTDKVATLTGTYSINGRSMVLHSREDDLGMGGNAGSLASGNAGSRMGCCVIGYSDGSRWQGSAARLSKMTMGTRSSRIIHPPSGR